MSKIALLGIAIPFLGTCIGSAFVFFVKTGLKPTINQSLNSFAAGVMLAASIWSLLLPAIEKSEYLGYLSFLPSFVGIVVAVLFMMIAEKLHASRLKFNKLILAVNIHNLPEGMAVGAVYAALINNASQSEYSAALLLSLGIAIQNIPEGSIISLPAYAHNRSKVKSFFKGIISAIIEPIGALLSIFLYTKMVAILPFMLSFAAAAMIYVVATDLLPENIGANGSIFPAVYFFSGFSIMMILDIVFA